jgi:LCP family protein required for cell wall assembly
VKKTIFLIFIIILLVAVAYRLSGEPGFLKASLSGQNHYLMAAPAGWTPTPTPFQPIPPTPLYLPNEMQIEDQTALMASTLATPAPEILPPTDEIPIWEGYAGPSVWPDIDMPAPMGVLDHPDGQVNILLLGSDQRPDDGGFRTDTIQLLTMNPTDDSVKLTAFPRDLYVYIPGYTVQRINTAMGWGGFEALAQTMEYNFGVKPDYYVLINFWSFKDVIDSMGGISVHASQDMCDQRDGYEWYCVYQGSTWMDGETALWYVRARHSTSDLDRGRRQQEVLQAIFNEMLSLNGLQRVPELYMVYQQNVTTNLDLDIISSLLPIAIHIADSQEIGRYSIGEQQVYDWTTPSGAMVLVPIREEVLNVMQQVISQP